MSFQMIHMEIAYRILKEFSQIQNQAEFILGSVAPDCVHMNLNYDIEMKIKSHMFEGCGEWSNTQDYQRWHDNIKNFLAKAVLERKNEREYIDFALGLCVHCLTDFCNDLKIWRNLQGQYVSQLGFDEFRRAYYIEARGIDVWLYQNSINTCEIFKLLEKARTFDVQGIITKGDLEQQKLHLLNVQYEAEPIDITNYHFLSKAVIEDFINSTVEMITNYLF